ncbi:MAG TPA: MinD/ParA family protein [Thermoflexia bacterium]|nr:MinD/ParA family protein [Thermoflexia bacterium]
MSKNNKVRVMIVDDIAETREQLRKLLSFDPDIEVVAMLGSGEEAVETVTDAAPDVVLMDINLIGIDGITATRQLLDVAPTVQVIMLSVQGEADYMRQAMMAGARDYLTKPPSADDLLDAIHRMAKLKPRSVIETLPPASAGGPRNDGSGRDGAQRAGKIITIFSPKGGTGCTTLAVNVAISLQKIVDDTTKVALVDASLQFGDVAIFLKIKPTRTIVDLAPRADELDTDLLNTVLVPHPSGIKVLAPPATPEEAEIVREGDAGESGDSLRFRTILEFMRGEFDYLLVDTHHVVDGITIAALDLSDLVLVVTRPTIPEIRGARVFVELLQKLGYGMEKIGLVINSVDNKRMGIQPKAIERAMMPAIAQLPLDEVIALRAANYGVPFVVKEPHADISTRMTQLARTIVDMFVEEDEEFAEETQERRRMGLGRLL